MLSTSLSLLHGCGALLGLDDYKIDDSETESGDGDSGGDGDISGDGDTSGDGGGDGDGDGDTSGDGDGDTSGDGDGTGGQDGTGGVIDNMGGMGSGGSPLSCDGALCDDSNDCTSERCINGECAITTLQEGRACDGGVCNGTIGAPACVRCVDDAAGPTPDSGCDEIAPHCDEAGTALCVECQEHQDCEDENECTTDTCASGSCEHQDAANGAVCSTGYCGGVPGAVFCVNCVNDESGDTVDTGCSAGAPRCDESEAPVCTGCEFDSDCGGDTPRCDENGACVECVNDGHCGGIAAHCSASNTCVECLNAAHCDDGVGCTDDTCSSGTCANTENNGNCSSSGDTCSPNVCDAVNDCQQVSVVPSEVELIQNGDFEDGDSNWEQQSRRGYVLIGATGPVDPRSGTKAAWLCGIENEFSDIYQWVTIPTTATEFTVSGYYLIDFQNSYASSNQGDADDYFRGRFYDKDLNPLGTAADRYIDLDGGAQTSGWVYFEKTYTNLAPFLPGQEIQFDFLCETDQNPGDVAFYVEDVSIVAKVCDP